MKKGLVLEGGAMRGMFTAGVLDVMLENCIDFDGAVGVSAGAAFGCNYKSRQIGRAIRYNMKFCRDKRYCGLYSLLTDGNIYSKSFCYGEVPLKHDIFDFDTFRSNPMEFYVVCTNIENGEAVYKKYEGTEDSGFDWIRASASMPAVSQIVEIDGLKLLDGAIVDSIPLEFFESIGYDKNIVVLTQPLGFEKKKMGAMPLMKILYRKYPKLIEALKQRHIRYNQQIDYILKKEEAGEILVIRPDTELNVKRVEKNPQRLHEAYKIGRRVATERLEKIKSYLNK